MFPSLQKALTGLLACALLVPAAASQALGPAKALSTDLTPGPAVGDQADPVVSRGATHALAVWVDHRTSLASGSDDQTGSDVLAARLDASGQLVDPSPIVISMEPGFQTKPRATWNGSHWLVTWTNQTATAVFYEEQIWGVRVAADGTVLDTSPIVIHTGANGLNTFEVASNGTDWLVVTQANSGSGLLGVRIAADGTVLDTPPAVLVPPTFFLYFDVQLASAGGNYLLVWDGTQSSLDPLQAQTLDGNLQPVGTPFTVSLDARFQGSPAMFLEVKSNGSALIGRRLQPDGVPIDQAPFPVALGGTVIGGPLSSSFDGTDFWFHFRSGQDVRAVRVTQAGVSVDPAAPVLAPLPQTGVFALGGAPSGGLFLALAQGIGNRDLEVRAVAPDFSVGAPVTVALSAPSAEFGDSVAVPGGAAVVWTSYSGNASHVWFDLVDKYGASAIPAPVLIGAGSAASVGYDGNVLAVAYTGSVFGSPTEVLVRRHGLDCRARIVRPRRRPRRAAPPRDRGSADTSLSRR